MTTKGRENIVKTDKGGRKLFYAVSKHPSHRCGSGTIKIPLFLNEICSIRLRIFNSTGFTVYSSELRADISPGSYIFSIPENQLRGRIVTGLYPVKIEAAGKSSVYKKEVIFLVIAGKR